MSFGWSAGDIAQAISLIVKVVKALDDGSGAPDEYRKMAVFLENVNLTLKNLHVFATLGQHPSYGDEIRKQAENIRPPLERFLNIMKKFEPHLGSNATPGWWKNIPRKMLWTFKHSHHKLKKEIKEYLFTLDNLLNRFTLEFVLTLPDELKQLFINTLTPQVISALEVMVNPVRSEISTIRSEGRRQQKELRSKAEEIIILLQLLKMDDSKSENNGALDAAVHNIKEHITNTLGSTSNNPQIPIIDSCSRMACNADSLPASKFSFRAMNGDPLEASDEEIKQSLRKIYYSIPLYAGMFLRNLCLYLANRLKLSRPLTPTLLAMYHITFHDALGRPPRVLQIDVFNNFQVFQAFLCQSFSDTVGQPWVERGSYLLANKSEKSALTADTWSRIIKPGCHIEMAMVLDYNNKLTNRCPDTNCSGALINMTHSTWRKCQSCQKEILEPDVAKKIEKSYAPVSQVATEQHETKVSEAINNATFARCVYRLNLQYPTAQSAEPLKPQKNDTELPTIQSKPALALQRSESKPDVRLSARPYAAASVSRKGDVYTWSCCWCRDYNGGYTPPQAHSSFPSTPPEHQQIPFNMTSPNHNSPSSTRQSAGNPANNHSPSTTATSLMRPPRFYMLRAFTNRLLPLTLFTVFLITGTVILIYSVIDKRVIPSNFIAGSYITIGVIIILWCLSRFILFIRESFGELGVDEAEAGLQGVNRVHVRGLWGREEGRVKKCLRWLIETPRSDGSKSPGGGDEVGNHGIRNHRGVPTQDPQVAEEGTELRDFEIHDQDSRIASSGLALPSFELLSNVPAYPFKPKPQRQPNGPNPHNPIQPRATSHQQPPSQTQRTPTPSPQETRNHRGPTLNPTITTSHDTLTVHHSTPPNPSQPVSYTDESRDVTSQTRLTPNILPLSLQINPGSTHPVPRSRPSKITRPLTQSS
ncbi:uncharacterized protein Bfra_010830 [Botrytis fragariae]|uniref:Ubiquitin-like domain-containing protein n=1 Tax=Botrytis fragariae TaxID=1964551 RepID=A0A8H6AKY6_9HELO|nr:uncharacterized protein Bfra_010830 [Botrytis fragariae]KAF5869633.1 hypothetical protein Bfra_010830 [Botrytis fragariae]